MIILRYSITCWFFFLSISSFAQGYFEITEDVAEAYRLSSTLQFDLARKKIAEIKISEPDNLLVYHAENYIDFFTIFINEDEDEYNRLEKNKKIRLKKLRTGNKNSPYYLFVEAEINLQWATARGKFGEKFKPLREIYRAYKLLEENQKRFPNFIANKKSLCIIHALGESMPGLLKTIMGVTGSIELGTSEIKAVIDYSNTNDFVFNDESYAIYAYILFFQNNKREEAYNLLKEANLDHSKSPLLCFLKANIAQKTGRTKEAIKILNERPRGDQYFDFPYLDFMYGKFMLYNLNPEAKTYMLKFVEEFNGRHFIKEAYQKLAWYELVTNEDIVSYKKYMELCQTQGYALVDEDKQALKESKEKEIPNMTLLKARLLFDGGYFAKGYNLLIRKSYLFIESSEYQLEFNYRMGRLTHELKSYTDAIKYYKKTIENGKKQDSYMACNSALQVALIYEKQGNIKLAKHYFDQCTDISPKEYKASLHQKAKSGLNRIKYLMK
ncbi:MAG: hypothetical protein V3V14_02265 [Saprospiraceae bacterium]